ncbi:MAG: hemerythrin domain-containing protein [Rhodospirillaceae bacterium]
MTVIEWRSEFSTGIASVDHEHRTLITLINRLGAELARAPAGGCAGGGDVGSGLLSEIHAAIAAHFALEEKVMLERRFQEFAAHKADHERLLDEIREIMEGYERGGYAGERDRLSRRLETWFTRHFRTLDARFHKWTVE